MQINLFKCKYIHKGNSDMLYCFKNIDFLIPLKINNIIIFCLVNKANICAIVPRIQEFE